MADLSNAAGARFDSFWALARRALPQACALCAAPSRDALVCAACARALPRIAPACPRCALPAPSGTLCGRCLVHPPSFDAALCAFAYAFPVDRLLQRLKYGGALALASWAAGAWVEALQQRATAGPAVALPDAIVPVPLTAARQRERGFNQASEIARGIAAALALPCVSWLERVRDAPPQAALPWEGRAANVRDAFRCTRALAREHVALVDDVMTTGATLGEAARSLRGAGAGVVSAWVIARTLPPEQA